jgi:hypothetical protein
MALAALLVLTLGTPALAQPTWTITPTPTAGNGSVLESVYAVSPVDAWADGLQFGANGSFSQLVEHWNGSAWQIASLPTVTPFSTELSSVSGTSAHDIWAVGYQFTSSSNTGPYPPKMTLIMHWNGSSFTQEPGPTSSTVAAVSPTQAWGTGRDANGDMTLTSWNGSTWSTVQTLPVGESLAALSANDVWAVGSQETAAGGLATLTMQWNGTAWVIVPSPNPQAGSPILIGVAAAAPSTLIAVGDGSGTSANQTLAMVSGNG